MEYIQSFSKPKYLCRWWMRSRQIKEITYSDGSRGALNEFYCPWWAKPLDFVWKMIFGNPVLIKE